MNTLLFDHPDGRFCQLMVGDVRLPESINAQMATAAVPKFEATGLTLRTDESELESPIDKPLLFEWQRLEWLFELGESERFKPPLRLLVNGNLQSTVSSRTVGGRTRLMGSMSLENSVGLTRFCVVDAHHRELFGLAAEVFPQKLDYKDDFPAMLEEITEVLYALVFDNFTKTFASTRPKTTQRQLVSEWLNLFRVLANSLEQSLDTLLRSPKSELRKEHSIKPIERVKKVAPAALKAASRRPDRYCRGDGYEAAPGIVISHLIDQRKHVDYDTAENRFVAWAIGQILQQIELALRVLPKQVRGQTERLQDELAELRQWQRRFRHRLLGPVLSRVGRFQNQTFFSTTLTMAAGYKEFYHRFLLLKRGLELADHELFKMDYKDIATLYEYWCFLKTVKLLRDNPKYDLVGNDVVKLQHSRLQVNLRKGRKSGVHFVQKSTGDEISMFFNCGFSRDQHTYTFEQKPDQFIEFSRQGFHSKGDKKTFKVVLDAKYRFDRGSESYPSSKVPYGPPLDTIAQLHRYRDAILWQEGMDESVRVANKSLGGVILFPYPDDESQFVEHPFYQSIDKVNIGAVPLQPGRHRENRLFQQYLDALFERSGEVITEAQIHRDTRLYDRRKQASQEWVLVGMIPKKDREARLEYHLNQQIYYIPRPASSKWVWDKVTQVALYDQKIQTIIGWADVISVDVMLGSDLRSTGTTWDARRPNQQHLVFKLGAIHKVEIPAGPQMAGHRSGRYMITRLGWELSLQEKDPQLQLISRWDDYIEWKQLKTRGSNVKVTRTDTGMDESGFDTSTIAFEVIESES